MQEKRKQVPEKRKNLQKMLAFTASSPTKAAKGRPLWQKYFFDGMLFSPDRFHLLAIVKALWPKYTAKTINPNPPFQGKFGFYCAGDPCGNRTHVNGVRGRCLNRLTNGPYKREAGIYLFSQVVSNQLSSAQVSLTSVFGMGTGGTSPSSTPAIQMTLSSASLFEDVPSKLNIELRCKQSI